MAYDLLEAGIASVWDNLAGVNVVGVPRLA